MARVPGFDSSTLSCYIGQPYGAREKGVKLGRGTVDAIFFDLDGTLMDTDNQAVESLAIRLRRLHVPRPESTARRLIMASERPVNALMTLVDLLGLDDGLLGFTDLLRRYRGLRNAPDFRIISGAGHMLKQVKEHCALGVVTTRSLRETEEFLEKHNLRSHFDIIVTRETTWRLKPHPAPLRFATQTLGVAPERCIMVGDTTVDMKAARRAGMAAVGVLCGFGAHRNLSKAGAHVIIEHTSEIVQLLS